MPAILLATPATRIIKTVSLNGTGLSCAVALLEDTHLSPIKALHDLVHTSLPEEEKSFILPRSTDYFARHFQRGNGNVVMGITHEDRLIAKSVILHPTAQCTAADLGGAILATPPETTSILQAATVHPDYQGQGLMQIMVAEWMAHAQAHGKTHAMAEIEVRNSRSWSTFLKIGLNIVRLGRSPIDGAEVYSAQERIKYAMTKVLDPHHPDWHDDEIVECAAHDLETQKALLDQHYIVVQHDRTRGVLVLRKPPTAPDSALSRSL